MLNRMPLNKMLLLSVACVASATVACGSGEEGVEFDQLRSATHDEDPDGQCIRIWRSYTGGRYLDAYTTGSRRVVLREFQNNDTQLWCFTKVGNDYRIQHRSFAGDYLDAYQTSSADYAVVVSSFQNNDTQLWQLVEVSRPNASGGTGDLHIEWNIRQKSNGRNLDAFNSSSLDYAAVTRPTQTDGSQDWALEDITVHL